MQDWERKKALPRGAQKAVREKTGYSVGFVSEVANQIAPVSKDARIVAVALSRRMKPRVPAAIAFPKYFNRAA